MEFALKFIRLGDEIAGDATGLKPALCFRGRKVAHAVINDETAVRAVVVTLQAYDLAAPVLQNGQPYPLARFLVHLQEYARRKGITERARVLLETGKDAPPDLELPPEEIATRDPVAAPTVVKPGPEATPETPGSLHKTATVPRSARAATGGSPSPPKTAKTATKSVAKVKPALPPGERDRTKYGGRGNAVHDLAEELKITPKALRIKLRAAGLHAPYTNVKAMRKALK